MNVAPTMVAVHTHAPTHPAHSSAAVELDTHWQGMERAAMVSRVGHVQDSLEQRGKNWEGGKREGVEW